jgi:hypothetical protein
VSQSVGQWSVTTTPPGTAYHTNSLFPQGAVWRCYSVLKASEMSINVTSVEAARRINPSPLGSLDRVGSNSAGQAAVPVRQLTRLDADYYAAHERTPTRSVPEPRTEQSPPLRDNAWLRLLERAVGGWAPTLRGSLLLMGLYVCASVLMVLAIGITGLALSAVGAVLLAWVNVAGRLPRA